MLKNKFMIIISLVSVHIHVFPSTRKVIKGLDGSRGTLLVFAVILYILNVPFFWEEGHVGMLLSKKKLL